MTRSYTAPRPDGWGAMDVSAVRLREPSGSTRDLTSHMHFIAPDDGNALDRTVMAVPLGRSVEPNETIQVELEWTAKIPRPFARTGYIGDFYFIAQWFPKLGVLEDSGWNTHQFHAPTEFYADFGVYDVRITVPITVHRRRHGPADGAHGQRRRDDDVPLSRGGRPRLRVDGEPGLHRSHADVHASDAAAGRDAAAAAARAPGPGRALLRRHRGGVEALRRMVRRLSVRPRDGRRPGLPEPGRRHGVPDVLHRPRPLASVAHARRRRR